MSEVVLLLGAELDIQSAYTQIAEHSIRSAESFDRTVQAALSQLADYSLSGRVYLGNFYRLVLRHYPYALFYSIETRRVLVHWLLDTRQNPESIRRRLGV